MVIWIDMEKGKKTSSSKKLAKSRRAKSRRNKSSKIQPDASGSSAMKNENTGTRPKKPESTKVQLDSCQSIPQKILKTGARPKTRQYTAVQPDSSGSSPEIIKMIQTCFISDDDEDKHVNERLAQAGPSEILAEFPDEERSVSVGELFNFLFGDPSTSTSDIWKDLADPESSKPSTSTSGVSENLADPQSSKPSTSTSGISADLADPQSSKPPTSFSIENLDDLNKFSQENELPLNISDGSDEETLSSIGDVFFKSPLTKEQQEKEERMTKIYMEGRKDSWEFYGKGSSDFDIPLWTKPEHPPFSAFGMRLNHLEKAATHNLSVIPEVVLDSD